MKRYNIIQSKLLEATREAIRLIGLVVSLTWRSLYGWDNIVILRWPQYGRLSNGCWMHYSDIIMSAIASQITGVSFVCLSVCSDADQKTHQSSASLAFVRGIYRWPVNSPHKGPVKWKMFPFDDVIMGMCDIAHWKVVCFTKVSRNIDRLFYRDMPNPYPAQPCVKCSNILDVISKIEMTKQVAWGNLFFYEYYCVFLIWNLIHVILVGNPLCC